MSDKADPAEVAKAEWQRQQAILEEIKQEHRDKGRNYRPCECSMEYHEQLKAVIAARQKYRELRNCRGVK